MRILRLLHREAIALKGKTVTNVGVLQQGKLFGRRRIRLIEG